MPEIDEVFVSTEDKEIAKIARANDAIVIDRPPDLSFDDSPEIMAWHHAVRWVQSNVGDFQRFVSLPTTAPLRAVSDVERCIDAFVPGVDLVLAISPASHNPWFNMVRVEAGNQVTRVLSSRAQISRLQDAPRAFVITTVAYVARPKFILGMSDLFDGHVVGVEVPTERALDIDTEHDFRFAEFLLEK
jgi:N-acylneuraminate cytidylyltransferase